MTGAAGPRFRMTVIPTGAPWNENCYLVLDTIAHEQIIIDPGGRSDVIRSTAEVAKAPVRAILLTHAHHDHVRAAERISQHFHVSCHIHSADFPLLRKAASYSIVFGGRAFPGVSDPVAIEDPGRLVFAEREMRILHTPGHTPGSCCFLFPGFAFTGDTLLNRRIGRTDLPGCDRQALIASVDLLLRRTDDDDLLYAGHRDPWLAKDAKKWWAVTRENASSLDTFEPESLQAETSS